MMNIEELKRLAEAATPIPEMDGYFIHRSGVVISTIPWRGLNIRMLIASPNSHGYHRVKLRAGRRMFVHRLVALMFLPKRPSDQHEIRHLDGNKSNNCASNLSWGTRKENAEDRCHHGMTARGERNGSSILTRVEVDCIKNASGSQRKIAAEYGISQRTVGRIKRGESWA